MSALDDLEVAGHNPQLRAGVHVGKPRKVGKDYFGVDVNIAARVAEGAEPGELLISDAAFEELDADSVEAKERKLEAKGVPEGIRVYAVTPKR